MMVVSIDLLPFRDYIVPQTRLNVNPFFKNFLKKFLGGGRPLGIASAIPSVATRVGVEAFVFVVPPIVIGFALVIEVLAVLVVEAAIIQFKIIHLQILLSLSYRYSIANEMLHFSHIIAAAGQICTDKINA